MSLPGSGLEDAVLGRYAEASREFEAALCCPITYDPRYLEAIPQEVLDRDYGCGDPSSHLREGETVLDLGSGGGKICFIASQVVGAAGRVIGVDFGGDMLALARGAAPRVAERIGYANVAFRRGRIQDLRLDLDLFDRELAAMPLTGADAYLKAQGIADRLRMEAPLIPDASVDVVVSNCVLNLVRPEDKTALFGEIYRVVRRGGRVVICDIVSDEDVPDRLVRDADLFSGCVSGAIREDRFLDAFAEAGFYGARILSRDETPWRTVEGIEFRSLTVEAFRGKEGPCLETRQAVVYRGPWKAVMDDDGHTLYRGERMAVCDKTFHIYTRAPYAGDIIPVEPREPVALSEAGPFACDTDARRPPRVTKGTDYSATTEPGGCGPGSACC